MPGPPLSRQQRRFLDWVVAASMAGAVLLPAFGMLKLYMAAEVTTGKQALSDADDAVQSRDVQSARVLNDEAERILIRVQMQRACHILIAVSICLTSIGVAVLLWMLTTSPDGWRDWWQRGVSCLIPVGILVSPFMTDRGWLWSMVLIEGTILFNLQWAVAAAVEEPPSPATLPGRLQRASALGWNVCVAHLAFPFVCPVKLEPLTVYRVILAGLIAWSAIAIYAAWLMLQLRRQVLMNRRP